MLCLLLGPVLPVGAAPPLRDALQQEPAGPEQVGANRGVRYLPPELLRDFYAQRDWQPLWDSAERRGALAEALASLADDGLDPRDYPLPAASESGSCAELRLSHSWALAVWHLLRGRLARSAHEPLWQAPQAQPGADAGTELLALLTAHSSHPAAALAAARPALPAYSALRDTLAGLSAHPEGWTALPPGKLLHPGDRDPRVTALRQQLYHYGDLAPGGTPPDSMRYDAALVAALRRFQYRHGLAADGVLGPRTLAALNQSPQTRRERLAVNLERWRWRRAEPFPDGVLVDIAGARIELRQGGRPRWRARTQVGTPQRPTPLLRSAIKRLTVNPAWVVPPTILRRDTLPALRADPGYLTAHAMEVLDLSGRVLDPATVDWARPGGIMLRQRPGPSNPLGRAALRFPNPFSVYLHDTPNQQLFSGAHRSHSSGCVRVEDALTLAQHLVETGQGEAGSLHSALESARTRELQLSREVPILLDYWTADVDDDGRVILRPDLYGRDPALAAALSRPLPVSPLPGCRTPLD